MVQFPPTYTPIQTHPRTSIFCALCEHEPKQWAERAGSVLGPCTGQDRCDLDDISIF